MSEVDAETLNPTPVPDQYPMELVGTGPPLSEIGQLIVALGKDIDIDKLEKLLMMKREQDELERSLRAREAYLEAKSAFLGECPVIGSDKKGGGGKGPKWNYPTYGQILSVALPIMAKHGLSHTTIPDFEAEIVTCVFKHTLGHEESATFPMTLKGQQEAAVSSLTLQQKWAYALTYAERQSFKAVSGVPTSDEDIDALPGKPPEAVEERDNVKRADQIQIDWVKARHELNGKPLKEKVRQFSAWFLMYTDAKTYTPVKDRWTEEQLYDCRKQLDKEAAARNKSQPQDMENTDVSTDEEDGPADQN